MIRISVCLDDAVAEWAKAEAAARKIPTARFIAALLRESRRDHRAMERVLASRFGSRRRGTN